MAIDPGPHHIERTRLIFSPNGSATLKTVTPTFFEELGDFRGEILVSRFAFDEAWPTWERHPAGDEFVYLLEGDTDFVLWSPAGERIVRVQEPGTYVVVPANTWHTARPRKRTCMLFVTPGEGTENAASPS
jgi:mannose-6-phosphate isomerase-like protein (cupin superfamily)